MENRDRHSNCGLIIFPASAYEVDGEWSKYAGVFNEARPYKIVPKVEEWHVYCHSEHFDEQKDGESRDNFPVYEPIRDSETGKFKFLRVVLS